MDVDGALDGAFDGAPDAEEMRGTRLLMAAVRLQQELIVAELVQPAWGADVGAADARGRTALHLAALHEGEVAQRVVASLLSRNPNADHADHGGRTPLHCAAEFGGLAEVPAPLALAPARPGRA